MPIDDLISGEIVLVSFHSVSGQPESFVVILKCQIVDVGPDR